MKKFFIFCFIFLGINLAQAEEYSYNLISEENISQENNIQTEEKIEEDPLEAIRKKMLEEETKKALEDYERGLKKYSNSKYKEDSSIEKFVGVDESLNDKEFRPAGLVKVKSTYIEGDGLLRKEAKEALDQLGKEFFEKFKKKIKVNSAYRSYEHQKRIAKNNPKCIKDHLCALPGHSEHQLGLAIDIFGISEHYFKNPKNKEQFYWLKENAHNYGYTQSYQKGKEIDGYESENWHWRFLGKELATELFEKKQTFTEYVRSIGLIK